MTLIRHTQPGATRLFPHQANRRFMVPNFVRRSLGPELIPDPEFLTWTAPDAPDGWTVAAADLNNFFEDGLPGLRCIAEGPIGTSLGLDNPTGLVTGATYTIEYEYSEQADDRPCRLLGGLDASMFAPVGERTVIPDLVCGPTTDLALTRLNTAAPTDFVLTFFSVRRQRPAP